jgi:hypothetical protein
MLSVLFTSVIITVISCDDPSPIDDKCPSPAGHIPSWTQSKYTIHKGESVTFTYTGEDVLGKGFVILWKFEGAVPDADNQYKNNPTIVYNEVGSFKVTCTVYPDCYENDKPSKEVDPAVTVIP